MASYDAFADFYNRDWGREYHAQIMSVLRTLLLPNLNPGDSVLDVGCGTGTVARELTELGYAVTGIDQSSAMLRFARENAPRARFLQADARTFELGQTFAGSIATFEAMNHLLTAEELTGTFARIAAHTDKLFVFDMNRESAYDLFWNGDHMVEQDGLTCQLTSSYDPIERIAVCRTEVGDQTTEIRERYYDAEHIESILRSVGFRKVKRFDGRRDLGMWGNVAIGRFFYQCFR